MPLQPGTRLTRDVAAVPGPVDRVHFLDEQRRHRRASWRFSVFAVATAVLSGLPLSILLSPLLFGLTLVVFHIVDLVAPIPASAWNTLEQVARAVPKTWAVMPEMAGPTVGASTAALVLPGAIVCSPCGCGSASCFGTWALVACSAASAHARRDAM